MTMRILQIDPTDDVAVAMTSLHVGDTVHHGESSLPINEEIPFGHKVALHPLQPGEVVRKYGQPIGHATHTINAGAWVHTHNLATSLSGILDYRYAPAPPVVIPGDCAATFQGFPRADGSVGIRNEIWVLPTVGCVNRTAEIIAGTAHAQWAGQGIDGVYAFPHPYGCSQLGEDHAATRRVLAALAQHPNAGGVLIVGLGCENNAIAAMQHELGAYDPQRIRFMNCQDVGNEIDEGLSHLAQLARCAAAARQPAPIAKLVVGLKCGGSDAFSGITANPLAGACSDRLCACGATTVLTEVPEMFGAEASLMARCADIATFERLVSMINDYKTYFTHHGQPISENPSPGNIAGGITTLEEKSLGCTQKAGRATITDILDYGARAQRPGVNLLNGPGNDLVAVTALAAAGCQIILFTTGRGTPVGSPAPVLKIASTTPLAAQKPQWIDFDAGRLLDGASQNETVDALMAAVMAVASGQRTRNEEHGYHDIAIWKNGVTL